MRSPAPTKTRIPLGQAEELAAELVELFAPHCSRIMIAGSIRRRVAEVGDIEILAEPLPGELVDGHHDLFGEPEKIEGPDAVTAYCRRLRSDGVLEDRPDVHGRPAFGPRFKRLRYKGIALDLFSRLEPAQFGVLSVIRTGPAEFSHQLVMPVGQKYRDHTGVMREGMLPTGYKVDKGGVYAIGSGELLPMPEEEDLFRLLGREWIRPSERR